MDRNTDGYDLTGVNLYNRTGKLLKYGDIEGLRCVLCMKLLRNPYQMIQCGHRCCKYCLFNILLTKDPSVCPEQSCGEAFSKEDVRTDKGCLKEIQSLTVTCSGAENGCEWRGKINELEDHIASCLYAIFECPEKCGKAFTREQLPYHLQHCPNKPDTCQYCSSVLPKGSSKESHYSICQMYPQGCQYCQKLVPRGKMSQHQISECDEVHTSCSFEGCTQKGKIGELNDHYKEHMHEIVSKMNSMLVSVSQLLLDNGNLQKLVTVMEQKLKNSEDEVSKLRLQVKEMPILQKQIHSLEEKLGPFLNKGLGSVSADSAYRSSVALDGKGDSDVGYISGAFGMSNNYPSDDLRSAVRRLETDLAIIKPSFDSIEQLRAQVVGYMETVQTVQESVTRHAVAMEEIKLRQDILDVKTTHGIFIWKIPEIERRYRDAQERRTLSLYSPPFHTSPHGYRMCIRAYLNGDGSGKGSHVSVFFVLMKSEHDNLLQWPFRRPVTFQLLNQDNSSLNISETFMPDVQSPSFQQPKSEMNIASGFPRFAKQACLKDPSFTKGDSIFIRCKIDITGLDKPE